MSSLSHRFTNQRDRIVHQMDEDNSDSYDITHVQVQVICSDGMSQMLCPTKASKRVSALLCA